MAHFAERLQDVVGSTPGTVDIDNTLSKGVPELRINVDRDKVADLGLSMMQIGSAVRLLVEGEVISRFKDGDDEHDIRLRVKKSQRDLTSSLKNFLIPSNKEIEGIDVFEYVRTRDRTYGMQIRKHYAEPYIITEQIAIDDPLKIPTASI